jgi:hypothetical protein
VLPTGRIFGRRIQKGPNKNIRGRKNLQLSFSTIFLIGAEFSKVYFSSLFLFNILIFLLKCTQKSVVLGQDFFSQRPNFVPDWLESSFKSWQHCRGNILEEVHAFIAVVLVGFKPPPLPVCTPSLPFPESFFSVCKLPGEWGGDK